MSTTLTELSTRALAALGDAASATWTATTIQTWIQEAIRDYSQHFKRTRTIALGIMGAAGEHRHELPDDFCGMVQVEYPTGDDPPVYLKRLSRKSPSFWQNAGYYDVEVTADAQYEDGEAVNPAIFWISDEIEDGQTITWTYVANHEIPTVASDYITVPEEHEHLLIKFVTWQALNERLAKEAQSPDTTIRMLQQFKLASQAAEQAYRYALSDAKKTLSGGGYTGPWRADLYDPIY